MTTTTTTTRMMYCCTLSKIQQSKPRLWLYSANGAKSYELSRENPRWSLAGNGRGTERLLGWGHRSTSGLAVDGDTDKNSSQLSCGLHHSWRCTTSQLRPELTRSSRHHAGHVLAGVSRRQSKQVSQLYYVIVDNTHHRDRRQVVAVLRYDRDARQCNRTADKTVLATILITSCKQVKVKR